MKGLGLFEVFFYRIGKLKVNSTGSHFLVAAVIYISELSTNFRVLKWGIDFALTSEIRNGKSHILV